MSDGTTRAATWLLRCNPGDELVHPACGRDRDGDGYPAAGDCDDSDSTVYPGADEFASLALKDINCDGWSRR